jgi:hypothetical protein
VVAESLLLKQQLLILNRAKSQFATPPLRDRVIAALCTVLMQPSRFSRAPPTFRLRGHADGMPASRGCLQADM